MQIKLLVEGGDMKPGPALSQKLGPAGVNINEVIAIGGVAKKSPFVMQTLADVLNMKIKVASSDQACAQGAAMFAAVVAGVYPHVEEAQKHMKQGIEKTYEPDKNKVEYYKEKYKKYKKLGDFTAGF